MSKTKIVVLGAKSVGEVSGLESLGAAAQLHFAVGVDELRAALPGAEVLLGWDFRAGEVEQAWDVADRLRWIQWGGAGVDSLLFEGLTRSAVTVTNAAGLFDRAMAEYVLGAILAHAKRFRESFACQAKRQWNYRVNTRVLGQRVLIVGVGSIGREIARLLTAVGFEVDGVGRTARGGDPDFGQVHGIDSLTERLPRANYVILVAPLTSESRDLFGKEQLGAMRDDAYLINVGRGELLDEAALLAALDAGRLAGAMLDVFRAEPLPPDSALWDHDNVFVSPHCSGDYLGYQDAVAELFLDNFARYTRGEPLRGVVDKRLGFVPSA